MDRRSSLIKESYIEFVSFYGCNLKNLFISHEPKSHSLVVLFPGRGYTCDMPLLYYAGMSTLFKGCDVLNLEYGFYKADKNYVSEDFNKVVNEIATIINMCTLNSYSNIYFISKSLGTLFAGELSVRMSNYNIKNLFLTPLEETIPYMISTKCIGVTGSQDKAFPSSSIGFVKNNSNTEIIIIDDVGHSLETEKSTTTNLEILQHIVKLYEDFVCTFPKADTEVYA